MSYYVVDASVAVKWLVAEELSAHADRLRRHSMTAPEFLSMEVANVLWKKVRREELDEDLAQSQLRALRGAPLKLTASTRLIGRAFDLALETGRTIYDSLYLALALAEGCQLITADKRFHNALSGKRHADQVLWLGDLPDRG